MLTGIPYDQQPEARRGWKAAKPVDRWQFMFSDLHKRNYMTLYSEDKGKSGAGTWQYRLSGFDKAPTTHYTNQVRFVVFNRHLLVEEKFLSRQTFQSITVKLRKFIFE